MSNLRTNYKDDVFTGSRKYDMVNNPDGTVSFTDETDYVQNGDTYGAAQINEVNDIINNLDNTAFRSTDGAETSIADNDYFPFYDTSASARKKTLWSNFKNVLTQIFAIKVHNSNSPNTYGAGTSSLYGHVKLSDNYTSSAGSADQSVGASSQAVYSSYNKFKSQLTANNNEIYMDYKNGKYGINTSANRGADTFIPFRANVGITQLMCYMGTNTDGGYANSVATLNTERARTLTYSDIYILRTEGNGNASVSLKIYGDNTLIHTKETSTEGTTAGATVNISGYSTVRIELNCYKESHQVAAIYQMYVRGIVID